jgi:hypothetical protein
VHNTGALLSSISLLPWRRTASSAAPDRSALARRLRWVTVPLLLWWTVTLSQPEYTLERPN